LIMLEGAATVRIPPQYITGRSSDWDIAWPA
jgi:hypothetical protein